MKKKRHNYSLFTFFCFFKSTILSRKRVANRNYEYRINNHKKKQIIKKTSVSSLKDFFKN